MDVITSRSLTPYAAVIASWKPGGVGAVGRRYSIADRAPRASQIPLARLEPQPAVLEARFFELARKLTVLAKQRQPLLVGPCKTIGVERNLHLEQVAVDDATDTRPAERDHHRRP